METEFYSRATGRLSKTSRQSYTVSQEHKKQSSTIYSIESNDKDSLQYPLAELTDTQQRFINEFLRSITGNYLVSVDPMVRGIHWIGLWRNEIENTTISCTISQPRIVNSTINLPGLNYTKASKYASKYFSDMDMGEPYILKTKSYCQTLGKLAMPFTDMLINDGIIDKNKVSWNMIVISQTQPIFNVILLDEAYECVLSHMSCQIISEQCPPSARISHPLSNSQNFSFRSSKLTEGRGTGPTITIHSSGILQYQGKPESIAEVASSFRDCILSVMESQYSSKFIQSLIVIKKVL